MYGVVRTPARTRAAPGFSAGSNPKTKEVKEAVDKVLAVELVAYVHEHECCGALTDIFLGKDSELVVQFRIVDRIGHRAAHL